MSHGFPLMQKVGSERYAVPTNSLQRIRNICSTCCLGGLSFGNRLVFDGEDLSEEIEEFISSILEDSQDEESAQYVRQMLRIPRKIRILLPIDDEWTRLINIVSDNTLTYNQTTTTSYIVEWNPARDFQLILRELTVLASWNRDLFAMEEDLVKEAVAAKNIKGGRELAEKVLAAIKVKANYDLSNEERLPFEFEKALEKINAYFTEAFPWLKDDGFREKIILAKQSDEADQLVVEQYDFVSDAPPKIGSVFRNKIGMEFCWIPPGTFEMGSPPTEFSKRDNEGPQSFVTIENGFWMGRLEVTQKQYEAVIGTNPSHFKNSKEDLPVEGVSWHDAKAFIEKLNQSEDEFVYSLPSESEWEYAARAGSRSAFAFGDDITSTQGAFQGRYGNAPRGPRITQTREVGSYKPNAWGLYDMHGNVWEWVEDIYQPTFRELPLNGIANVERNPSLTGSSRVLRGGAWNVEAIQCRSASRVDFNSEHKRFNENNLGFRVVARLRNQIRFTGSSAADENNADNKINAAPHDIGLVSVSDNVLHPTEYEIKSSVQPSLGSIVKNASGIEFCWIPPGAFLMGSPPSESGSKMDEGPQRKVTFDRDFWIGRFPITQLQYQAVMGSNPSFSKKCGKSCPVEGVSWFEAKEFVARLNAFNDEFLYSLPSESDWEYAARAGSTSPFTTGQTIDGSQAHLNRTLEDSTANRIPYPILTTKVGSYSPNGWGLYDVHGNVWEWVEDIYQNTYLGLPCDGTANTSVGNPLLRVIRGGGWSKYGNAVRIAHRMSQTPETKSSDIGFRIVARVR